MHHEQSWIFLSCFFLSLGGAAALAPAAAGDVKTEVITSTNTTLQNLEIPGEKRLKSGGGEGIGPQAAPAKPGETPVYSVIQTANPISALYEYCKKGKNIVKRPLIGF